MISVDSLIFLSLTFSLGMLLLIRFHYYTPKLVEETSSVLSVPTQEKRKLLPIIPEVVDTPPISTTEPEVIIDSFVEAPPEEKEEQGPKPSLLKKLIQPKKEVVAENEIESEEDEVLLEEELELEEDSKNVKIITGEEMLVEGLELEEEVEEEPLYEDGRGNKLYVSDLKRDWVNYDQLGKKEMSEDALKYHTRGRKLSKLGAYGDARKLLKKAAALADSSPYPFYDLAMVYVMRGDSIQALTLFKRCDELAPKGFFETKTALAALNMEQSGSIPEGTFRLYLQIEETQDRKKKVELARQLTERYPHFAPGWRAMANLLQDPVQRKEVIEEGLNANPDIDTYANLKINEALILDMDGKKSDAIRILGQLIFDEKNTLGSIGIAKFVMSSILNV